MKLFRWIKVLRRKIEAKNEGLKFRQIVWYNYRAMIPKDYLKDESFIEIFDKDGFYINCPQIGKEVIYNNKGKRYIYKIVDFKNESRNRDWLYDTDYINPIIEYVGKLKE